MQVLHSQSGAARPAQPQGEGGPPGSLLAETLGRRRGGGQQHAPPGGEGGWGAGLAAVAWAPDQIVEGLELTLTAPASSSACSGIPRSWSPTRSRRAASSPRSSPLRSKAEPRVGGPVTEPSSGRSPGLLSLSPPPARLLARRHADLHRRRPRVRRRAARTARHRSRPCPARAAGGAARPARDPRAPSPPGDRGSSPLEWQITA